MRKKRVFLISIVIMLLLAGCASETENSDLNESAGTEDTSEEEVSEISSQQFINIDIDLQQGAIKIISGDEFSFLYEDGSEAEYTIEDYNLTINAHQQKDLVLTLPEDYTYNTITFTIEEGNIIAEGSLSTGDLKLNVENGDVDLAEITVSESTTIEAKQSTILLSGTLETMVDAQCEEAHLNMELTGEQTAYNYTLTISDAQIRIGDDNYGEPGSETIDNNGQYTMTLSCTKGDIDIDFGD